MEARTKFLKKYTIGLREMHHGVIILEEVHLIDSLQRLDTELLDNCFDLFVVVDLH
jgi:hypothetical protein